MSTVVKIVLAIAISNLICVHKEILGQANNGQPTLSGTLALTDCASFPISTFLSYDCAFTNGTYCDSHCRCAHGAKWGECTERPSGGPVASVGSINNQMCACYYDTSPPGNATNQLDKILCPVWMLANKENYLCNAVQVNVTAGGCSSDCICAHAFLGGFCDPKTNFCLCHNNVTELNNPN